LLEGNFEVERLTLQDEKTEGIQLDENYALAFTLSAATEGAKPKIEIGRVLHRETRTHNADIG
jgi:hypothetical protein